MTSPAVAEVLADSVVSDGGRPRRALCPPLS